jgi:hypothetical protein
MADSDNLAIRLIITVGPSECPGSEYERHDQRRFHCTAQ